jgi:homoserine O-acetyltransferase
VDPRPSVDGSWIFKGMPLKRENNKINMLTQTESQTGKELVLIPSVTLTSGITVTNIPIVYEVSDSSWRRKPIVLVIHALTGSSHAKSTSFDAAPGWWEAFIGSESASVDLNKFSVISPNLPGSCYGSWLPDQISGSTLSVKDISRVLEAFLNQLQVTAIHAVLGGSLGGMIGLQLVKNKNLTIDKAVVISCGARQSAWAKSWGHLGLNALKSASTVKEGLSLARQIAMISYRTHSDFESKDQSGSVQSYLDYQGQKFVDRFNPWAYEVLVRAMDTHDIGQDVLDTPTEILVIGNTQDVLYPVADQKEIVRLFTNSFYFEFSSDKGHDAFLTDDDVLNPVIGKFLTS